MCLIDGGRSSAHEMYIKQAMVLSASCDEPMLFWELGLSWKWLEQAFPVTAAKWSPSARYWREVPWLADRLADRLALWLAARFISAD